MAPRLRSIISAAAILDVLVSIVFSGNQMCQLQRMVPESFFAAITALPGLKLSGVSK